MGGGPSYHRLLDMLILTVLSLISQSHVHAFSKARLVEFDDKMTLNAKQLIITFYFKFEFNSFRIRSKNVQ